MYNSKLKHTIMIIRAYWHIAFILISLVSFIGLAYIYDSVFLNRIIICSLILGMILFIRLHQNNYRNQFSHVENTSKKTKQ